MCSTRSSLCLLLLSTATVPAQEFTLGPDSQRVSGVPQGKVTNARLEEQQDLPRHRSATAGLRPRPVRRHEAGLRHGLPGRRQLRRRAKATSASPIVFDNLIHKKEMPVTIGIFINPGDVPTAGQGRREAAARTAASSTTRSPTSTPASW